MLKLKLKRNEKVMIDIGDKRMGLMVTGYGPGGYHVVFSAPKEIRIVRENAKKQTLNNSTEESNELQQST